MSTVQSFLGFLLFLAGIATCYWIDTVNARIVSYAERIWGYVSLLLLFGAIVTFWLVAQHLSAPPGETAAGTLVGLIFLCLCYYFYYVWQAALDEETY